MNKLNKKIKKVVGLSLAQMLRIYFYRYISDMTVTAKISQPIQCMGKGTLNISNTVTFGYRFSKDFFSKYIYIEARNEESEISIGRNTFISNSFSAIANSSKIVIGSECLFGTDVQIYDSDFHGLAPETRRTTSGKSLPVYIEDNVFVGNSVIILKGCRIGKNSVIAAGSLVCNDIPDNVIAGGVPCKVIRAL